MTAVDSSASMAIRETGPSLSSRRIDATDDVIAAAMVVGSSRAATAAGLSQWTSGSDTVVQQQQKPIGHRSAVGGSRIASSVFLLWRRLFVRKFTYLFIYLSYNMSAESRRRRCGQSKETDRLARAYDWRRHDVAHCTVASLGIPTVLRGGRRADGTIFATARLYLCRTMEKNPLVTLRDDVHCVHCSIPTGDEFPKTPLRRHHYNMYSSRAFRLILVGTVAYNNMSSLQMGI